MFSVNWKRGGSVGPVPPNPLHYSNNYKSTNRVNVFHNISALLGLVSVVFSLKLEVGQGSTSEIFWTSQDS